ncbi:MAG: MazG-like family protein [Gloeomargaritales cyanobacterium]
MYFIYHIPTKKIGVTRNINKRVTIAQGYKIGEFEVLEASEDIDYISKRESELQRLYGYKVDRQSYKQLMTSKKSKKSNQMKLNVTDQTTTFPCPVNKLKGQLNDVIGLTFETPFGNYYLNKELIDWIMTNVKVSMFNPNRCFIYNKALHESVSVNLNPIKHIEETLAPPIKEQPNVYDLIRGWANERGIYKDGDAKTQFVKLQEEAGELARAILKNNKEELIDAIGDMMVVLTNLAALEGLKVEDCVVSAYQVIEKRTGKMVNGSFVKDTLTKTGTTAKAINKTTMTTNPYPGVTIKTTL